MSQGTNKLQILNHCSKDFQCRIVAFMLNIRQWYNILRRDSKFLERVMLHVQCACFDSWLGQPSIRQN